MSKSLGVECRNIRIKRPENENLWLIVIQRDGNFTAESLLIETDPVDYLINYLQDYHIINQTRITREQFEALKAKGYDY